MRSNGAVRTILFGCVAAFLLGELIVRVLQCAPPMLTSHASYRFVNNEKILYDLPPGTKIDKSWINEYGCKDSRFSVSKQPHAVRIAMLGDSITQGVYVELGKTFSDRLEDSLNEKSIAAQSPVRYEVMNFGVNGYNMEAELAVFKEKVLQFSPDVVILNYYFNDADPIPGYHMFFLKPDQNISTEERRMIVERYYVQRSYPRVIRNILFSSHLYRFILNAVSHVYRKGFSHESFFKREPGLMMSENEKTRVESMLAEFRTLSNEHAFPFLIALHPFLPFEDHPNNACVADLAEQLAIPYFYLSDYYRRALGGMGKDFHIGLDACHLNEDGHGLAARAFESELRALGIVVDVEKSGDRLQTGEERGLEEATV